MIEKNEDLPPITALPGHGGSAVVTTVNKLQFGLVNCKILSHSRSSKKKKKKVLPWLMVVFASVGSVVKGLVSVFE